jgi:hypothetical protein
MSSIFSLKQWGLETRNLALKTCGEEKPENVKDPEKRMHTSLCALIISLHLGVYIYIYIYVRMYYKVQLKQELTQAKVRCWRYKLDV